MTQPKGKNNHKNIREKEPQANSEYKSLAKTGKMQMLFDRGVAMSTEIQMPRVPVTILEAILSSWFQQMKE
jgi:hypothetical protein